MKKKVTRVVCIAASGMMALASPVGVLAAYTDPDASLEMEAAHAAISQEVASEGMILLDNSEAALPLKSNQVALYGAGTWNTVRGGTGSGATYLRNGHITVWQGFQNAGYEIVNSAYVERSNAAFQEQAASEDQGALDTGAVILDVPYTDEDKAEIEAIDPSVTAIYTVNRLSGEGADLQLQKGDYYLTDAEYQNLKTLAEHFDHVVVVLNTGAVMDTSFYNGLGTPDYENHIITDQIHDVLYEPGVYYTSEDGSEYTLAEGEFEEGTQYYEQTEDYMEAAVNEDTFTADGSLYTATLTYEPVTISNADEIDPDATYYTSSGEGQYTAVSVNAINFAQYDGLYMGVNEYTPVEGDAAFDGNTVYYQKGGYRPVDLSSSFKTYQEAGCLYVQDGDSYRLVTEEDSYDPEAVYAESYNTEKIEGLSALVNMSQGGVNGGAALVELLSGEKNFSGKTVDTWAKNFSDYPSSETFSWLDGDTTEENYTDDIYVGYRYFDTYGVEPAYPFGFGLSYTDFAINVDSVEADTEQVTVTATVTNNGDATGKEVVEVYFSAPEDTDIDMAFQELAGYTKTDLIEPGESQTVTVTFATEDLSSYYEEQAAYIIEAGDYTIRVGNSSRNTVEAATITVDEDVVTEQCENLLTLTKQNMIDGTYDASATMSSEAYPIDMLTGSDVGIEPTAEGLSAEKASLSLAAADFPETVTHTYTEQAVTAYVGEDSDYEAGENETVEVVETSGDGTYTLVDVYRGDITMEQFLADLTPLEMIDLVQGESYEGLAPSSKDSDIIGYEAPKTYGSCGGVTSNLYNSRYVPNTETADGGAGIRINPEFQVYDAVPVDAEYDENTTYYTCQFSAWGGSSYNEIEFADADEFRETLNSGTRLYTTEGVMAYQYCTATPIGTCIAQTWNADLAEEMGRAVAEEMMAYGVTYWLAPAFNIHRNPLCGRNFEYYSEDPVVCAIQAGALTHGVMYDEEGNSTGVSTMPKHYAVNSQENDRFGGNNMASERAIREIYLKAFEKIIKEEQPFAVMSCYNQVNGIPGYNNYSLLTEIPLNEWGFEGFFCTDWLSYYGSMNCTAEATSSKVPSTNAKAYDSGSEYGVTADNAYMTQAWEMMAGQSLEMPGQNEELLITAWENGEVRLGDLQRNAERILNVTMRSKAFSDMLEKLEAAGK